MGINRFFLIGLSVLCFFSCIKEEPLYREADITSFTLDPKIMVSSIISDNKIQIIVTEDTDYTSLIPVISISPGATVTPASGEMVDFTNNVTYTVASEDRRYSKEYTVKVSSRLSLKYDFEEWGLAGSSWKYPALTDIMWSSANLGVMLAKLGQIDNYPTRSTDDAVLGKSAALLETMEGGTFWDKFISIFPGSLFLGDFVIDTNNFSNSAKFGQIHSKENGKPLSFTGYYKYTRGEHFIDSKGDTIPDRSDECSIYAVLYKVAKGDAGKEEYLDGTDILTSDKVIARAILENSEEGNEYIYFDIPFVYNEDMNYDLNDYKLAVVFASSKNGVNYEGAPGSKLTIDEVEIICEDIKE